MIHSVTANKESFRAVHFHTGLNLIVADRTATSSSRDTRNGLGKSTLIDIIDFCLGGSSKKGKKLNIEPLQDWIFSLEVTIGLDRVTITRAVANANRIIVNGDTTNWPHPPLLDNKSGESFLNLAKWQENLAHFLFGLKSYKGPREHRPSYRSLISYFIRTKPGAYLDPFKYIPQQKGVISQVNIAFLLGISWENASLIQEIEDISLGLSVLSSGKLPGAETVGELEAQKVQIQQKATKLAEAIDSFLVHPQYTDIQKEADRITADLHQLANDNISSRRQLAQYKESIQSESTTTLLNIEKLYEESGLIFTQGATKTLSQAKGFHDKIISNRRDFLGTEVERIERAILERESEIKQLSEERAQSLEILQTHGALQEVTKLQEKNVRVTENLSEVTSRIAQQKSFTDQKRKNKIAREDAIKSMELDHEDRRAKWEHALRLFADNSNVLYNVPGKLVIDVGKTGYAFRVEITRDGSEGVNKMKVYCFDLALLQLQRKAPAQIDFLIHDTLMYDSVDSRQRAKALERAEKVTREANAQYICTINSDMIPSSDFSEGFDYREYVRMTLDDATPAGSLLGMRFERPKK